MIDDIAREVAIRRYALAECLHVPIAAVDEAAISTYIGEVQSVLSGGSARRAFLVLAKTPAPPDPRFPIWDVEGCDILHRPLQVWVDVAYTRYRRAYGLAFPDEVLVDRRSTLPSDQGASTLTSLARLGRPEGTAGGGRDAYTYASRPPRGGASLGMSRSRAG